MACRQPLRFATYSQQVCIGKSNNTISLALTLNIDSDQKAKEIQFIEGLRFDGVYHKVVFHPFVSSNTISHNVVQRYLQ